VLLTTEIRKKERRIRKKRNANIKQRKPKNNNNEVQIIIIVIPSPSIHVMVGLHAAASVVIDDPILFGSVRILYHLLGQ
jgi:hypothetical protein